MPFHFCAALRVYSCLLILMLCGCTDQSDTPTDGSHHSPEVINPNYTGAMVDAKSQTVLVWGSDGAVQRSDDGVAWEFIATPTTAQLNKIRSHNNTFIAIGEQGTLLRSTDTGKLWAKISTDTTANLKALAYAHEHQRWFVVGTGGTLLRSDDDGLNWQKIVLGKGLDMLDIDAIFVSPKSQRLVVGGARGLFGLSDDGGANWQAMQLDLDTPLSGFYQFNDRLIATSAYGKLLVSQDDGNTWQLIETDGQAFFNHGTFDAEGNTFVLVSHNGKVLRTADNAETWQLINAPFHGVANYLASVRVDSTQKLLHAFGHYGTHLTSRDGGLTWTSQAQHSQTPFEDVIALADGKTYIAFGRGGLLATSGDRGDHWQNHQAQLDIYWRKALVSSRGTWLLAGELGYIVRSTNKGNTWQLLDIAYTNPMMPPTYRALIEEPQSNALIAAGPTGTIVRSTDDGESWQEVHYTPFDNAEAFTDLLIDTANQHLIAIEAEGRHYVSTDQGKSWIATPLETQRKFWHGSMLTREQSSVVLITGQAGVAARSPDGGKSWQALDTNTTADLFGSYADQHHQQLFLLGAGGTLLRSRDDGQSWQAITLPTQSDLRRMTMDPNTKALLAFGGDGTILRSSNAGDSWQAIESGTPQELRDAVVEPDTKNLLLTGRDGKVIRSTNGGVNWENLPTHTASHFRSLTVDPHTGAVLAVGERIVRID